MVFRLNGEWNQTVQIEGESFTCGYCGSASGPSRGYICSNSRYPITEYAKILICPTCNYPTFINSSTLKQVPSPKFGKEVEFLPEEIEQLYNEARKCISVNAYTPAVLACRKLLMNIAFNKGAEEGKKFIYYVEYLNDNHYIPPNGKGWVDHIRVKGNEATHEITSMSKDDAIELLEFTELLLRFVFELPGKMAKYKTE